MNINEIKTRAYFLISAYTVVVGILYEWGYWGRFNINVLPFMSLSEVVRSFAYPFVASFIFVFIGSLLNALYPSRVPEEGSRKTHLPMWFVVASLIVNLALVIMLWLTDNSLRWIATAFLFLIPFPSRGGKYSFVQQLLLSAAVRSFVVHITIAMPVFALALGATKAEQILHGTVYDVATISGEAGDFKYIGHAGEFLFLLMSDNHTVQLRRASSVSTVTLFRVDKTLSLADLGIKW